MNEIIFKVNSLQNRLGIKRVLFAEYPNFYIGRDSLIPKYRIISRHIFSRPIAARMRNTFGKDPQRNLNLLEWLWNLICDLKT